MGKEQDYYINAKNYNSILNGLVKMQIYNSETNDYFIVYSNNTAQKLNASTVLEKVTEIRYSEEDTIILNFNCKKLILKTQNTSTVYYYSPEIKVKAEYFKNHNYGNWNEYLEASQGALPVLYIYKDKNISWMSEAIKIEAMELSENDFILPKDIVLKE